MIFAITQELEQYDIEEAPIGLYSTYFQRSPVLFNLITRTSLIPFQYEPGSTVTKPFFLIDDDVMYEETLPQTVGGETVKRLCCDLSPIQMLEYFEKHKDGLPGLGITRYWYGNVDLLLDVMRARVIAWKWKQRGIINRREDGVIMAQFGSLITKEEQEFVIRMNPYHKDNVDVNVKQEEVKG